ncbi:hypothetical protein [Nocardia sp. NPDC050710]|uniref:DUF7832 domain-containing protein n=1 Tax=Nocardia sp. NPDC050710 TaxID=3157220 RepID=UPI0033E4BF28
MTYDDAGWHTDSVVDLGLPLAAAGTHIAMFMAWLVLHDLATEDQSTRGRGLRDRSVTPGQYLSSDCCGEIDPFMLNDTGNAFTKAAYRSYLGAYLGIPVIASLDSSYEAPDSWQTYDAVAEEIDRLFRMWRSGGD